MEESKALLAHNTTTSKLGNHTDATYVVKQNTSDIEEGEVSSDYNDEAVNKSRLLESSKFVARLPSYCRVNPNLPLSSINQQVAIVKGIDRRLVTDESRIVSSQHTTISHGATTGSGGLQGGGADAFRYRLSDFEKIEKIGEGTFGKVYKVEYRDPITGEVKHFALKKLNMIMDEMSDQGFPLTALREIKYLSTLNHENIVAIRQVIHAKPSSKNKMRGNYFLLFDYLNFDLTGMTDKKIKFTVPQIKCIMQQLLKGLMYLHDQKNLCHRDIKGANILLSRKGQVQIADFGLARILQPANPKGVYTNRVVTLWYRAPELLLGFRNYNFGVDIWSMACVFAEIVTGQVLFRAAAEAEACQVIFKLCGSPTETTMPGCSKQRNYFSLVSDFSQPRKIKEHLKSLLAKNHLLAGIEDGQGVDEVLSEHWFDLIDQMLCLDPNKRLKASQALAHPFFTDETQPKTCEPHELPVDQVEDQHEYITKAERHKKKDFRKAYTFRHNLDTTNYNHDVEKRYYGMTSQQSQSHSFWKATQATTASTITQAPFAPAASSNPHTNQTTSYSSNSWNQTSDRPKPSYLKPVPPYRNTNPRHSSDSRQYGGGGGGRPDWQRDGGNHYSQAGYRRPIDNSNAFNNVQSQPETSYINELKTTAPPKVTTDSTAPSNLDSIKKPDLPEDRPLQDPLHHRSKIANYQKNSMERGDHLGHPSEPRPSEPRYEGNHHRDHNDHKFNRPRRNSSEWQTSSKAHHYQIKDKESVSSKYLDSRDRQEYPSHDKHRANRFEHSRRGDNYDQRQSSKHSSSGSSQSRYNSADKYSQGTKNDRDRRDRRYAEGSAKYSGKSSSSRPYGGNFKERRRSRSRSRSKSPYKDAKSPRQVSRDKPKNQSPISKPLEAEVVKAPKVQQKNETQDSLKVEPTSQSEAQQNKQDLKGEDQVIQPLLKTTKQDATEPSDLAETKDKHQSSEESSNNKFKTFTISSGKKPSEQPHITAPYRPPYNPRDRIQSQDRGRDPTFGGDSHLSSNWQSNDRSYHQNSRGRPHHRERYNSRGPLPGSFNNQDAPFSSNREHNSRDHNNRDHNSRDHNNFRDSRHPANFRDQDRREGNYHHSLNRGEPSHYGNHGNSGRREGGSSNDRYENRPRPSFQGHQSNQHSRPSGGMGSRGGYQR